MIIKVKGVKGISLPINMVVIIAVAVIVLLSLAAFFMSGFIHPTAKMSDTDAWNTGCGMWRMRGCKLADVDDITILGYDPDGDGEDDSLAVACARAFHYPLGDKTKKCDKTNEDTALYGANAKPTEIQSGTCDPTKNPCWVKCCGYV